MPERPSEPSGTPALLPWDAARQEQAFSAIAKAHADLHRALPAASQQSLHAGRAFEDWIGLFEKAVEMDNAQATREVLEALEDTHPGVAALADKGLVAAVRGRRMECVRVILLQKPSMLLWQELSHWESLMLAIETALINDDPHCLRLIVEAPSVRYGLPDLLSTSHRFGKVVASVLIRAVQLRSPNCVEYLAPIGSPDVCVEQGNALMCVALTTRMNADVRTIAECLLKVSDARLLSPSGYSALMLAVGRENVEMVQRLLPASDVNARGPGGRTSLEQALYLNSTKARECADAIALYMHEDAVQRGLDKSRQPWSVLPQAQAKFEREKLALAIGARPSLSAPVLGVVAAKQERPGRAETASEPEGGFSPPKNWHAPLEQDVPHRVADPLTGRLQDSPAPILDIPLGSESTGVAKRTVRRL